MNISKDGHIYQVSADYTSVSGTIDVYESTGGYVGRIEWNNNNECGSTFRAYDSDPSDMEEDYLPRDIYWSLAGLDNKTSPKAADAAIKEAAEWLVAASH